MASTSFVHPLRLVAVGAEALVEGHPGEVGDPVGERRASGPRPGRTRRRAGAPRRRAPCPRTISAAAAPSPFVTAAKRAMRPAVVAQRDRTSGGGRGPSRGPRAAASGTPPGTSPTTTVGYSTRSRHSSRRPWSSHVPPLAAARSLVLDPGRALLGREDHEPLAQAPARSSANERTSTGSPARALRQEAVAARRAAALARRPGPSPRPRARGWRTARRRRRAGRRASGSAGRTGRRPGRRRARRPSSCASGTRARAGRRRGGPAATSARRAPGHLPDVQQVELARLRRVLGALAAGPRPRPRSSSRSPAPRPSTSPPRPSRP